MPPAAIVDPAKLDFSRLLATREQIQAVNPQRHEFALLDGVIECDAENTIYAGFHDVLPDAWWARGHIPGRPLFPGVLMVEVAAQLLSFVCHYRTKTDQFLGFSAIQEVKFRAPVQPPARLVMVTRAREMSRRRFTFESQGFLEATMVFEGVISGMVV